MVNFTGNPPNRGLKNIFNIYIGGPIKVVNFTGKPPNRGLNNIYNIYRRSYICGQLYRETTKQRCRQYIQYIYIYGPI